MCTMRKMRSIKAVLQVKCPHCNIGPMIAKTFGYYQCRLIQKPNIPGFEFPYLPQDIDTSLFNPKCLLMQKLG